MLGVFSRFVLGLAVCLAVPATAQDKTLNLYIWSDYLAPDTIDNFTKETGITVNIDNFDSSEMLEAKLLAGGSGYDVVVPNGPVLGRLIKSGIVRPLDKAKLSNISTQDPVTVSRAATQDPGNAHAIVYMWGTSGLGYNVAKVKEVLGSDAPVDSWSLILDPANAAKLAKCGIYAFDSPADIFELTLSYLGKNPNSTTPADYEAAAEVWKKIRPSITKFHNSEYITALANGDVCVAMGYSGDIFQAADRAKEAGNGIEIAYSIPKEGAIMWFDFLAIPKDAPHAENAYAFLNYILRPEVVAAISNHVYYANPNLKAAPFMSKELLDDPAVYPSPEVTAKLLTETIPTPEIERLRTRLWTRVKTGS
ncbi:MAG: polyamine ABC transporter substrate-binding protein [Rhodospirillaceae bacterium]|nr:polyamine ABC transporter substrate-binding protein [Rhodospirillaceae bacterium]